MIKRHFYNIIKQVLITSIAFLLVIQSGRSQPQNFELKQISEEHGLPGTIVRAIFQDSKQILWFGIESTGLCRYDGGNFTLYSNNSKDSSSIGNNFVNTICEDNDGYLWIGTDNGLFRFDRETEKFKPYYSIENNKNCLYGNQIYKVIVNSDGELWVGTNKGLNVYDKKSDQFIRVPYFDNGKELNFQVNSICFDSANNTWIGTFAGLFKLEYKTHNFTRWTNLPNQPNSLLNNQVNGIGFDRQGSLWITTVAGCTKYDPKHDRFYEFNELLPYGLTSSSLLLDSKGFIWIGGSGLAIFNPENNTYKIYQKNYNDPTGLITNDIRSIYEDKSGLVWIGTKFEGLLIYNYRNELFPHWKNQKNSDHKGLNDKNVYAVCEDKNQNLYFGAHENGLNVLDPKTETFTYYIHDEKKPNSIPENDIYNLQLDNNNIWITTSNYLSKFDIYKKTFTPYPYQRIRVLFNDLTGKLWLGKKPGLFIFDKKRGTFSAFHDSTNVFPEKNDLEITFINQDKGGKMWFGTYRDGVFEYDPIVGKMVHYRNDPNDSTSLSDNMVRSIYEDGKGRLWIGTRLQGLNLLNRTNNSFSKFTISDGLPSNSVFCILEDNQGYLWLATSNGISKFSPESKSFENFTKDDGLQDNVFKIGVSCKTKSGELIFGGNNGFNMFIPEKIKKEVYQSPLVITSIKVFDETIYRDINEPIKITLPYKKNYLSFDFALLDYVDPKKNQYQYKMENVDVNWINFGNRQYTSYSSLAPGDYCFTVKAANSFGIWTEKGVSVTITILKPWWQTILFKIIIALLVITLWIVGFSVRVYRLKKQQFILESKVEEKTLQLKIKNEQLDEQNKSKDKFFSIIAHDLKNPIGTILGFTSLLADDTYHFKEKERNEMTKNVHDSTQKIFNLLENLLMWSRSQLNHIKVTPTLYNLTNQIYQVIYLLEESATVKSIKLIFEENKEIIVFADMQMIDTVIRNLITNAIKFSSENETVKIELIEDEDKAICSIADKGVGMTKEQISTLFKFDQVTTTQGTKGEKGTGLGLSLCLDFLEKNGGKIWVKSTPGNGSTFYFSLPTKKNG